MVQLVRCTQTVERSDSWKMSTAEAAVDVDVVDQEVGGAVRRDATGDRDQNPEAIDIGPEEEQDDRYCGEHDGKAIVAFQAPGGRQVVAPVPRPGEAVHGPAVLSRCDGLHAEKRNRENCQGDAHDQCFTVWSPADAAELRSRCGLRHSNRFRRPSGRIR